MDMIYFIIIEAYQVKEKPKCIFKNEDFVN